MVATDGDGKGAVIVDCGRAAVEESGVSKSSRQGAKRRGGLFHWPKFSKYVNCNPYLADECTLLGRIPSVSLAITHQVTVDYLTYHNLFTRPIFTKFCARLYATRAYIPWLCARLCLCPSVKSWSSIETEERIEMVFGTGDIITHTV